MRTNSVKRPNLPILATVAVLVLVVLLLLIRGEQVAELADRSLREDASTGSVAAALPDDDAAANGGLNTECVMHFGSSIAMRVSTGWWKFRRWTRSSPGGLWLMGNRGALRM